LDVEHRGKGFEMISLDQTSALSGKCSPGEEVRYEPDTFDDPEVQRSVLNQGRPDEFSIVLQKGPDPDSRGLGLDVDVSDGPTLLVDAVQEGLIKRWNTEHPDQEVRCRDRFINVNGVRGDARKMIEELSNAETLNIYFKRPSEFSVRVRNPNEQDSIGLDLKYSNGGATLLVEAVNDGVVDDWNKENVGAAVSKGDRIYEVNGIQGDSKELYNVLTTSDQLELKCMKAVGMMI